MRVWSHGLGAFGTNCYIIACTETGESAVIDPGADSPWLAETLAEGGLTPGQILLTHGHLDHIGGIASLRKLTAATVAVHGDDATMLTDPMRNGSANFGMRITAPPADRMLRDGDVVQVGSLRFTVIHTPGHTPGGCCFYYEGDGGHLFAGDTLFAGSIGRTDLAGGDHGALLRSIREKLLPLPADTVVYPGHGPTTSIGDEAEYNPFLSNLT
ncbi:MAG: putative Zn-dependent hydrolase [Symbiobacteriaceae bacterium]|jgi:glyoxylase-like metal-dependent hydrolase (beta-lactamase superfamily II)|nr:putative Zn-dependent hydrolase [Symbiobacteriaceae bacterium]